jgi:hypothetical protein
VRLSTPPLLDATGSGGIGSGTGARIARLRACRVTHAESEFWVTPRMCTRRDRISIAKSTHRLPKPPRLHREEVEGQDPPALAPQELAPGGAGSPGSRAETVDRSSVRIFVAETMMASSASSPRILRHPHLGFSLPIGTMSPRSSSLIDGLPPPDARRKVHFLRTSPRCQRRSVWGVTTNDDYRGRGSARLNAAITSRSRRWRRSRPT